MKLEMQKHIREMFIDKFNNEPLLVKSPGRINLIGEHTDYNDGFVFPAAIDKGIVTAVEKSNKVSCIVYSQDNNQTLEFSLDKLSAFSENGWQNYVIGVVAEIQKKGLELHAFNMVFGGDVPIGSGLSSSAALENSIVFALNELFDLGLSKLEMIHISQAAEHNYVGVKCGIMDQFASMFGIKNHALFLDCRTLEVKPVKIDFEDYDIVLINSNVKHALVENAYNERREVCEKVAELLGVRALREASETDLIKLKTQLTEAEFNKALYVVQENERVKRAMEFLSVYDLKGFGELLFESHKGLSEMYDVSCEELDFLIEMAKKDGYVIGARMMGGGFGGCTINIVEKQSVDDFVIRVRQAYLKKFKRSCSEYKVRLSDGTQLIE